MEKQQKGRFAAFLSSMQQSSEGKLGGVDCGTYLFFENLSTEHFTFTSELYNSATGGSYPLWGKVRFKIINWFSVLPWVVHFF